MKQYFRNLIIVSCLLLGVCPAFSQSFIHPGIDMNKEDLEYMRAGSKRE